MNKREKILAAAAGLIGVGFVTYMAINRVFLMPAAQQFNQAKELVIQIEKARAEKAREASYKTRLAELAARTYGTDELKVSESIRTKITAVLAASGLSAERLTLKPITGARVPGVYKEVGWMVQVAGGLEKIINFLYLMTKEPHLHRLDNLVISPIQGRSDVDLQVKYATLVLQPPDGQTLATGKVTAETDPAALESPDRKQYQVIATRDLFRPYIAARRPEPTRPTPQPSAPSAPRPPEVPRGRYKLVGLPTWGGKTDILIRDSSSGNVASYKPGDDLADGTIVMVDYRPLPMPSRPEILSSSRIVLRVGAEYYAVELGRYLSEKHTLKTEHLPPGLPQVKQEPPPPGTPSTEGETQ